MDVIGDTYVKDFLQKLILSFRYLEAINLFTTHPFTMPTCPAITARGSQCSANGMYFEYHCLTHHKKKLREDPAYATRFTTKFPDGATELEMILENRRTEEAARIAANHAANEAARIQKRTNKMNRNMRALAEVDTYSPMKIINVGKRLMTLWRIENIPLYDIPMAYAILTYRSPKVDHYTQLLTACVKIMHLANGYHPDHDRYSEVPEAERTEAHDELHRALAHWDDLHITDILPANDPNSVTVRQRQEAQAEAEARRIRDAQFAEDMRLRAVVFQRDPEGSINLAAFANDEQSVHRSSVQVATEHAVGILMGRPLDVAQDTLAEITDDLNNPRVVKWNSPIQRDASVTEITNDYFNTVAFSVQYGDVLDHIWAFIRKHTNHKDLVIRLAQEVYEGRAQCPNGKMARLVNVLQGFDDALFDAVHKVAAPPRELLQGRMSVLSQRPREEREAAARALFTEFQIPEAEHAAWLEPLLEA